MADDLVPHGLARRDALRTGVAGFGALLGVMGMSGAAEAAGKGGGLAGSGPAGSTSLFLKLDGIPGESRDERHRDEIELLSYHWGLSNHARPGGGGGAGGGGGKATFVDLHVTAVTSIASPRLFVACASGRHLKSAQLTVRKAGDRPLDFITVVLSDVLVSSYDTGATTETVPVDAVGLAFAKIVYSYVPQNPDGSPGTAVVGSWDLRANRP